MRDGRKADRRQVGARWRPARLPGPRVWLAAMAESGQVATMAATLSKGGGLSVYGRLAAGLVGLALQGVFLSLSLRFLA